MRFKMQTYYRVEFLPPVMAFVSSIAQALGATDKEIFQIRMAAEEAGMHIIGRYPGSGLEERFEVLCEPQDGGLLVTFNNLGLPINLLAMPKYEITDPDQNIDGLGLFLMEKMVDHHEFINQGREGWKTVLFKRFERLKLPEHRPEGSSDELTASREKLQVMKATAEHVPDIVELAYRSYGYSYSKELFYFADLLRAALEEDSIESFVALNPAGRVVGQVAVISSPFGRDVVEIGAVMVRPEYRRSTGLLQLIRAVASSVRTGVDAPMIAESNLVTTHTLSQRVSGLFKFKPMALKISVHGRARFVSIQENTAAQREPLLHVVSLGVPSLELTLFIPPEHDAFTRHLFENAGIALKTPCAANPEPADTLCDADIHAEYEYATLFIRRPGHDYAELLRQRLYELETDGIKTVFVRFPGWQPIPETLKNTARQLRLFFCGWVMETPTHWWMLYTRLNAQRFNFEAIQIHDPKAVELRDYVQKQFQEIRS